MGSKILLRFALVALVLSFCVVGQNDARAFLVDDFSTDQTLLLFNPGTTLANSSSGLGVVGIERDLELNRISGTGMTMIASGGTLSYTHIGVSAGDGTMVWDGIDGSNVLDPTGLGGVDFTDAGLSVEFAVVFLASDFVTDGITFTVYTDATNFSTMTADLPAAAGTLVLPFASFTQGGVGPADFANVGALEVAIDGSTPSAINISLNTIQTVTPEPSTLSLLLGSLTLLAMARRGRML